MIKPLPVCVGCAHFDQHNQEAMRCSAFPEGIPREFSEGRMVHRNAYIGDRGIRYEPRHVHVESNITYWKTMEYGSNSGRLVANGWEIEENEG